MRVYGNVYCFLLFVSLIRLFCAPFHTRYSFLWVSHLGVGFSFGNHRCTTLSPLDIFPSHFYDISFTLELQHNVTMPQFEHSFPSCQIVAFICSCSNAATVLKEGSRRTLLDALAMCESSFCQSSSSAPGGSTMFPSAHLPPHLDYSLLAHVISFC